MNKKVLFASLLTGLMLVSCGNKGEEPKPEPKPNPDEETVKPDAPVEVKAESVAIEGLKNVKLGDVVKLNAKVLPENAKDKTVTWSSSDETVAKIVDGKLNVLKTGTVKISVKSNSVETVTNEVELTVYHDYADLAEEKININVLPEEEIKIINGDEAVDLTKYDIEVAKIGKKDPDPNTVIKHENGIITTLAKGQAKLVLTEKLAEGSTETPEKKEIKVYVGAIPTAIVASLVKDGEAVSSYNVITGGYFKPYINYEGSSACRTIRVDSSDESVVKVNDSGDIIALKAGTAKVSITHRRDSSITTSFDIVVADQTVAIPEGALKFDLGEDNMENAGKEMDRGATFPEGGYSAGEQKLVVESTGKVYTNSFNKKGNCGIKLGAGSGTGSISFTVADNVKEVYLEVQNYHAQNSQVKIGEELYDLSTSSDFSEVYNIVKIDTSTNKEVTISNAVKGLNIVIYSINLVYNA